MAEQGSTRGHPGSGPPDRHLGLVPRQELRLEPRLLQSIEVLALPAAELELWLCEAAAENEALHVEGPAREVPGGGPPRRAGSSEDTARHDAFLASVASEGGGLAERLVEELALADLGEEEEAWARLVVRSLDPRGYLSLSDEELLRLADEEGLAGGPGALGRAIATVQGLEPRGVGGRDAVEALLLQLDPGEPDYALLCRLIEEFLEELVRNKLPAVARGLGVELERLEGLLLRLKDLTLEPGGGARPRASAARAPVVPDLVVEPVGEGWEVRTTAGAVAGVSVDAGVEALARDRGQPARVRQYLRGRVERARWVVEALALRERTLLRVARAALDRQRAFLERGPGHLEPLAMGAVAGLLGVHLSTVSRAVAGKHLDTPWGIVPLRSLFQRRSGGGGGGGGGGAQDEVRRLVGTLIAEEDASAPLSDEALTERLRAQGVRLSRRAVADVRRALGLPSSYRRRRYL